MSKKSRNPRQGRVGPTRQQMDDYLAQVREIIAQAGWLCQGVFAVEPGDHNFCYTVGLAALPVLPSPGVAAAQHPEVIIFGLPPEVANHILNIVGERMRGGEQFRPGRKYDNIVANLPCAFLEVTFENQMQYMGVANRLHFDDGRPFSTLQLVWPDSHGNLPWDEGFDEQFRAVQPLLGTAAVWFPLPTKGDS